MTYYSISDIATRRYWQCGSWVFGLQNATKYRNKDDADGVIALRFKTLFPSGYGQAVVVGNDTEYVQHVPLPALE